MAQQDDDNIEATFSHLNVIEAKFKHLENRLNKLAGCLTPMETELMDIACDMCETFREYIKISKQ